MQELVEKTPSTTGSVSRKRFLGVVLVIFFPLFLGSLLVATTINEVKQFRARPTLSYFLNQFSHSWPQNFLARVLIFRPGGFLYQRTIRSWTYLEYPEHVSDNMLNRWLLEEDVSSMSIEDQGFYLANYPLIPSTKIRLILEEILNSLENGHVIIPVLSKTEEGRILCSQWIEQKLLHSADTSLFRASISDLIQVDSIPLTQLVNKYYPYLESKERSIITSSMINNVNIGSQTSDFLLHFLEKEFDAARLNIGWDTSKLLAGYLSSSDDHYDTALRITQRNLSRVEVDEVRSIIEYTLWVSELTDVRRIHFLTELFHSLKSDSPSAALEIFHVLSHEYLDKAEELAVSELALPDSEIRKGIIVTLVRHESPLGYQHVEEAFQGSAPRTIYFKEPVQYLGTKAAEEYVRISGHKYVGTKKEWPPFILDNRVLESEAEEWRIFIDTYPWFPGTDDAYYRLGYCYFEMGQFVLAYEIVNEYFSREFADIDADPFILRLLKELANRNDPDLESKYPEIALFRPRRQLGELILEDSPNLKPFEELLVLIRANSSLQRVIDIEPEIIGAAETLIRIMKQTSNREEMIGDVINSFFITEDDKVEWRGRWPENSYTLHAALYLVLLDTEYPDRPIDDLQFELLGKIAKQIQGQVFSSSRSSEQKVLALWARCHYEMYPSRYEYWSGIKEKFEYAKYLEQFMANLRK